MVKHVSEIVEINKLGILFSNGEKILFEECIMTSDTFCVAKRDITANPPYFEFNNKGIRIIFTYKGIRSKIKNKKTFYKLQGVIQKYGYRTYDLS